LTILILIDYADVIETRSRCLILVYIILILFCIRRWLKEISEGEGSATAAGATSRRGEREQYSGLAVLPTPANPATTTDVDADDRGLKAQPRGSVGHPEADLLGTNELVDRRNALNPTGQLVSGLLCRTITTNRVLRTSPCFLRGEQARQTNRIEVTSPVLGESAIGRVAARCEEYW